MNFSMKLLQLLTPYFLLIHIILFFPLLDTILIITRVPVSHVQAKNQADYGVSGKWKYLS